MHSFCKCYHIFHLKTRFLYFIKIHLSSFAWFPIFNWIVSFVNSNRVFPVFTILFTFHKMFKAVWVKIENYQRIRPEAVCKHHTLAVCIKLIILRRHHVRACSSQTQIGGSLSWSVKKNFTKLKKKHGANIYYVYNPIVTATCEKPSAGRLTKSSRFVWRL